MQDAILVLGYNNTRINDVKTIRATAKKCLNAATVLCKPAPNDSDKSAVDGVIDVTLAQDPDNKNISQIIKHCRENNIRIVGVLPFSDPGTQLGAQLAHYLNLPGADPTKISAALNKYEFRVQEQQPHPNKPEDYVAVQTQKITSLEELQLVFKKFNSAIFLKPMAEGNSRGCIAIKEYAACEPAWHAVKKYLSHGIVAEQLIENGAEYSWEHVAGYSWITEKVTTKTEYRAEPQHIFPAPISDVSAKKLTQGAIFMAKLCGYNGSACHNEIFLLNDKNNNNKIMAVEPNIRPGGGKLWDLSRHAFIDFDPWTLWLQWAAGKLDSTPKLLTQQCFVGMRFITAIHNGTIQNILINNLTQLVKKIAGDFIELVWTKKIGDSVTHFPQDNADFLGYFTAKSLDYNKLANLLLEAENILANSCIIK